MSDSHHWPLKCEFRAHPLVRGGHLQTLFAAYGWRERISYSARQHNIATSGGDQVVLHEDRPADWSNGDRCAVLIHGLCGCHASPYMVRIANKLNARRVLTFRMDMRGCGAGFHLAKQPGHAGRSEDLAAVIAFIEHYCPQSPIVILGVSLGGNVLLKLLGEWGREPPSCVERAMAVAPPADLLACAQNIERPWMFPYNRWFVRMLMQQVHARREFVPELTEVLAAGVPRSLMQFDDRITSRLSGFDGAHDYYTQSSSLSLLCNIRVPTVILAADDDPVVPVDLFTRAQPSSCVTLHVTRGGGHVGYYGRTNGDADRYWLDWRAIEFLVES